MSSNQCGIYRGVSLTRIIESAAKATQVPLPSMVPAPTAPGNAGKRSATRSHIEVRIEKHPKIYIFSTNVDEPHGPPVRPNQTEQKKLVGKMEALVVL